MDTKVPPINLGGRIPDAQAAWQVVGVRECGGRTVLSRHRERWSAEANARGFRRRKRHYVRIEVKFGTCLST